MSQALPSKSFRSIGDATGDVSRRAVSYTPAANMTLRHWSFIAMRLVNTTSQYYASLNEVSTITWEIRSEDPNIARPHTTAASLLASGSFDWRYTSAWRLYRPIKYTINLTTPLTLTGSERYWFILKMPSDERYATYPLGWVDTYVSGASGEVDSAVYSSEFVYGTGWYVGENTYNLTLYVLNEQAGQEWHVIIDGEGYMMPDKMRGYRCEQATSGLAQTRGGQSEWSQLRYPYSNLSQDGWLSGSGELDKGEDEQAFLYALAVDTTIPHQAILGPALHLTGLESTNPAYEPTSVRARHLPDPLNSRKAEGAATMFAQKFTAPTGGMNATQLGIRANRMGWQRRYTLSLALFNDASGPNERITDWVEIAPAYKWAWRDGTITSEALTSETDYWIVVKTDQVWGTLAEYRIMFDQDGSAAGGAAKYSRVGTTWSTLTGYSMAFRINYGASGALEGTVAAIKYGTVGGAAGLFCLAGKTVYEWSEGDGHWDDISTGIGGTGVDTLTADGTDLLIFNDYLFVAQGLDNPIRIYDGTNWISADDTELVTNGAFTSATTGWTAVDAQCTLSSEAGGQSGNCLKVLAGDNTWASGYQEVTVVASTWYEFRAYHKNGGGTAENHIKLGTAEGDDTNWNSGSLDDADWTEYIKVFKTGAAQTSVFINLYASDENAAYGLFDTVTLEAAPVAKYFHIGKGYLYRSNAVNTVNHTNTGFAWSADETVGENLFEITAFVNFQGLLLAGKEDGIWREDNGLWTEYWMFREHASVDNCKGMTVWSGMLFVPVQSSVWRWQGSQYRVTGPTDKSAGPTKDWPNRVSRLSSLPSMLLATSTPIVSTGWNGLMAYNGLGWHHLTAGTRTNQASNAICVTTEIGTNEIRVWFGEGDRVTYVIYPTFTDNRYDWTSADFEITSGTLVSSWWDGGLKDALKFWNRLTMIADIPDDTSIEVFCSRDGEDWNGFSDFIWLGEVTNQQLTDNGEYVLMFPDGMIAKTVQPIFSLKTEDSSKTPRLRAFNVESAVRQIPVYAYTFRILLADNITKMDDTTDTRSAEDTWELLRRAASKNEPIVVSLPYKSFRGMISYLSESTGSYKPEGMTKEVWERVAVISVVEAT